MESKTKQCPICLEMIPEYRYSFHIQDCFFKHLGYDQSESFTTSSKIWFVTYKKKHTVVKRKTNMWRSVL